MIASQLAISLVGVGEVPEPEDVFSFLVHSFTSLIPPFVARWQFDTFLGNMNEICFNTCTHASL